MSEWHVLFYTQALARLGTCNASSQNTFPPTLFASIFTLKLNSHDKFFKPISILFFRFNKHDAVFLKFAVCQNSSDKWEKWVF